jgi:EEF1A lysine methyltransferase 4
MGYRDQVSFDFSLTAIEAMRVKHADLALEWKVMDVRKMELVDGLFNVAIDKGTLDAMLHGSLWDPEDDVKANVRAYVDEVARVLKPGGTWLYITYRQPHFLKPLLAREGVWTIQVETLEDAPGTFEYFGFVIRKHGP